MSESELTQAAYRHFYLPRCAARAISIAHQPCPLERIIRKGQYHGLDASTHAELMWLAELALTPELPVGWIAWQNTDSNAPFYWHPAALLSQWEHPYESFISGLAQRLVQARQMAQKQVPASMPKQ